jgi:hypothetical protein
MVDINLTPGALVYSTVAAIASKEEHRIAETTLFVSILCSMPNICSTLTLFKDRDEKIMRDNVRERQSAGLAVGLIGEAEDQDTVCIQMLRI